jgi:4,5-DOPA dioxygenase extradiol
MAAPTLFISHGSPMIAVDPGDFGPALHAWAARAPRPRAVLVVSAHFQTDAGAAVTSSEHPETVHDFGGFDHGAWIPLRFLFPQADVPVVELSLPADGGWEGLARLGAHLRPLRSDGVWIVGSGGLVHNFRSLAWKDPHAPVPAWAADAEARFMEQVRRRDVAGAVRLATEDAGMRMAAPTPEHLAPAFVTLGASTAEDEYQDVYVGFRHATLSMRTFAFTPRA